MKEGRAEKEEQTDPNRSREKQEEGADSAKDLEEVAAAPQKLKPHSSAL